MCVCLGGEQTLHNMTNYNEWMHRKLEEIPPAENSLHHCRFNTIRDGYAGDDCLSRLPFTLRSVFTIK